MSPYLFFNLEPQEVRGHEGPHLSNALPDGSRGLESQRPDHCYLYVGEIILSAAGA